MKKLITILAIFLLGIGNAQTTEMNISYGEHSQQKYDIYFPENWDENTPVFNFVHGGGWSVVAVQRHRYRPFIEAMAANSNIIIVNMDYRLIIPRDANNILQETPVYAFPHMIDDIESVMTHFKENYGLQNNPITLGGNSAGGQLTAWYAFQNWDKIDKVIPIVAPYDGTIIEANGLPYASNGIDLTISLQMVRPDQLLEAGYELTIEDGIEFASPRTYQNNLQRVLGIYGTRDALIPNHQWEALLEDGLPQENLYTYRGGHSSWAHANHVAGVMTRMIEFILTDIEDDEPEVCEVPTNVELVRTSHTTATFNTPNNQFRYQGSANRAGRPLRPYPMYGMENMTVPHIQERLVPAFDYDVWLRTICDDGTYSEWTEALYLPRLEASKTKGNYYNIHGVFMGNDYEQLPRGYYIKNDGQESIKIYKK